MAIGYYPDNPLPVGDDNGIPIRNWETDPHWRIWAKKDMWLGGDANQKYIPKIGDYVEDTDYHITYQVRSLNEFWIPTLVRITPKPIADMDSEDLLIGPSSDTYRCFIDPAVMPHRLQVDGRCYINAKNASTARVYRGNPINGIEEIISLILDQAGIPIGTQIPLQLSYIPNGQNVARHYIPTAYTTTDVKDGEFLYVVLFDDTGAVLSSRELRAVVTSFTASTDLSIKAVTGITMEGPLMSTLIPNRLEVPLHLTLSSINLRGRVEYNSGSPKTLNVDGTRFELLGLGAYTPTQAGQHFKMKLKYNLAGDEVSYVEGRVGNDRFIIEEIDCITIDVENQLTSKLYPYPVWDATRRVYSLRWFLLNLDRDIMYDVTPLVQMGVESPGFDPNLFGQRQSLTVVIDLSKVNGTWREWRHVQTVDITILRAGDRLVEGTLWRIGFDPNQNPEYGNNNMLRSRFVNQNLSDVDMQSGYGSMEQWLDAFYYNTKPLLNPELEVEPVVPDHVIITDGGQSSIRLKISEYWNRRFQVNFPVLDGETWYMKFVKQTSTTDLVLSVAGVPVQQVQSW